MDEPLCGWTWYEKHHRDYTQRQIDSLSITITRAGEKLSIPNRPGAKGIIKKHGKKGAKLWVTI